MALIAHYKLEADGTATVGPDLTSVNAGTYALGKLGNALTIVSGSGSTTTKPSTLQGLTGFNINQNVWSMTMWVLPNSSLWASLAERFSALDVGGYYLSNKTSITIRREAVAGQRILEVALYENLVSKTKPTAHSFTTNDVADWIFLALYCDGTNLYYSSWAIESGFRTTSSAIYWNSTTYPFDDTIYFGGYRSATSDWRNPIDDVRIYDHCLSTKEVLDLTKAQIAHWTFDRQEEYTRNIYSSVTNVVGATGGSSATVGNWQKYVGGSTYGVLRIYSLLANLTNGGIYTASVEVMNPSTSSLSIIADWCDTSPTATYVLQPGESRRIYITGTRATYDDTYRFADFSYGAGVTVFMKDFQIEYKDHPTSYTSGTRADVLTDSSGQGYDLTAAAGDASNNQSPQWLTTSAVGAGCAYFNGISRTYPSRSSTAFRILPLTVSLWVRSSGLASGMTVNGVLCISYAFRITMSSSGTVTFYTYDGAWNSVTSSGHSSLYDNAWHHIVCTITAAGAKIIYIDAVSRGTGSGSMLWNWTNDLFLGTDPNNYSVCSFYGSIDDVRIYRSTLSSTDVQELYSTKASVSKDSALIVRDVYETGPEYVPSITPNYATWVPGGSLTPVGAYAYGFTPNGDSTCIVVRDNPVGVPDVMWASINNDVASDNDGGWGDSYYAAIDGTKKHRYSIWMRKENSANGSFYLGLYSQGSTNNVLNLIDGSADNNPYFYANSWGGIPLPLNTWILLTGYVWPIGTANTATITGRIYYADGTEIVSAAREYKWETGVTSALLRTYHFYSTDPDAHVYFYRPRVDACDGTEPSIADLLACRENPNLLTTCLPSLQLSWVLVNVTMNATGGLYKSGGADTSWNASAYSRVGYVGGAYLRFRVKIPGPAAAYFMLGLTTDPALDNTYTSLDYAFYNQELYYVYENGVSTATGIVPRVNDLLEIVYDNVNVKYYINGVLVKTTAVAANLKLYVDSAFYYITASESIADIYFGPADTVPGLRSTGTWITPEINEVGSLNTYIESDGGLGTPLLIEG